MDYFFQSPFLSTSCEIWEYVKNLCVIPSEEIGKPKNGIFRSVVIDIDVCDFDRAFNLPLTFHADVLLFSPANRHEFLMLTILFVSKLLEIAIEESEHVRARLVVPAHQQLVFNSLSEFLGLHLRKRACANYQRLDQSDQYKTRIYF